MSNLKQNQAVDIHQPAISDASTLAILKVSGADAETFLQGQLTHDITLLTPEKSELAALCTPKGRVLVLFRIFKKADDFYLILPKERVEAIEKRLRLFVLMSQVIIENLSEKWTCLGLSTDEIIINDIDEVKTKDDISFIRVQSNTPLARFLVILPTDKKADFWQNKAKTMQQTHIDFWEWQDIQAGLPQILNATAELFVPQMLNLDQINGLSFTKGCYTGQEVVSRMHYLGKTKRLMFNAHIDLADTIQAGDALYSASSQSAQGAGKVVNVQKSPTGGMDCLIVAEIKQAKENNLQLKDEKGAFFVINSDSL